MPSKGYATVGLKPAIIAKLQKDTDEFYPGMFLPSALIIMMNEIKRGYYSVGMHNLKADFSGVYTSLTIRSDIKAWLEENYENMREDYSKKYMATSFTQFAGIFMLNTFESKAGAQNNVIRLKEADFRWLVEEYGKRREEYKAKHGIYTFERFADIFLKDLLDRIGEAKKILTV